jgi:hypothetical protein
MLQVSFVGDTGAFCLLGGISSHHPEALARSEAVRLLPWFAVSSWRRPISMAMTLQTFWIVFEIQ